MSNFSWYEPSQLQPSGPTFSVVWTCLYTLIGISGFVLWNENKPLFYFYLFHLILNLTWAPLLNSAKNLQFSMYHLILIFICAFIIFIFGSTTIKALFGPYLFWLIYAGIILLDTIHIN
jgi:tryptophan-rich sensory protein